MTKEEIDEIVSDISVDHEPGGGGWLDTDDKKKAVGTLFDKINEFSKQQSIAFSEWKDANGFRRERGRKNKQRVYGKWYVPSAGYGGGEPTVFTSEELYTLFLEQSKNVK